MKNLSFALAIIILFNSCATMIGGSKYYAQINVPNHPQAKIYKNGQYLGTGSTMISVKRRDANKLNFEIKEENYPDVRFVFSNKNFRGGTLAGSLSWLVILFWPVTLVSTIVDGATGAWWKPNKHEPGITKIDYKNYRYTLNHSVEPIKKKEKETKTKVEKEEKKDDFISQQDKLRDLKKMNDEGIIDDDEYRVMRRKVLGIEIELPKSSNNVDSTETQKEANKVEDTTNKIEENEDPTEKEAIIKTTEKEEVSAEEVKLSEEDQEKLNDLDKMLELGVITQKEYDEMKSKLIDKK